MRKAPSGPDFPVPATVPSWRTRRRVVSTGLSGQGSSARCTGQVGPAVTRPSTPDGQGAKAPAPGPPPADPGPQGGGQAFAPGHGGGQDPVGGTGSAAAPPGGAVLAGQGCGQVYAGRLWAVAVPPETLVSPDPLPADPPPAPQAGGQAYAVPAGPVDVVSQGGGQA